jgi:tetratricopeptide (TPR) repeat protein
VLQWRLQGLGKDGSGQGLNSADQKIRVLQSTLARLQERTQAKEATQVLLQQEAKLLAELEGATAEIREQEMEHGEYGADREHEVAEQMRELNTRIKGEQRRRKERHRRRKQGLPEQDGEEGVCFDGKSKKEGGDKSAREKCQSKSKAGAAGPGSGTARSGTARGGTEAERLSRHAHKLHAEGDVQAAVAAFEQAIQSDPALADAHANYGLLLQHDLKRYDGPDGAETHFRTAISLAPTSPVHTMNLASFVNKIRGDGKEAETIYMRGLQMHPAHAVSGGGI